jgi:hypothetical protein
MAEQLIRIVASLLVDGNKDFGLDWIELDLDWIGLDWIGLDWRSVNINDWI